MDCSFYFVLNKYSLLSVFKRLALFPQVGHLASSLKMCIISTVTTSDMTI